MCHAYWKKALPLAVFFFFVVVVGLQVWPQLTNSADWATLSTGNEPVAIVITQLDGQMGWDLIVLNTKISDLAQQQVQSFADATIDRGGISPTETQQLRALPDNAGKSGSVSVFYGTRDGRFCLGNENILYQEVAVNKTSSEGILRAEERLSSISPATIVLDGSSILIGSNRSPYVFNLSGSNLDNITLVNNNIFKKTEDLNNLEFPLGDLGMATGDFNSDGKPDLVLANDGSYTVTVYQGDGNGGFFETLTTDNSTTKTKMHEWIVGKAGDEPHFATVADLNNDGNDDIIVAKSGILSREVWVVLGNGDGTFKDPTKYPSTQRPRSVAVADFNNDGKLDLLVAGSNNLALLLGRDGGTFGGKKQVGNINLPEDLTFPVGIVVKDFNCDGNMDFAVTNTGSDSVDVYEGAGNGVFSKHTISIGSGTSPIALASEDLNWDGAADLAVVNYGTDEVVILLNDSNGNFVRNRTPRVGIGISSLLAGDFDGDEATDLAFTHETLKLAVSMSSIYTNDKNVSSMKLVQKLVISYEQYTTNAQLDVAYSGGAVLGLSLLEGEEPDGSFRLLTRDSSSASHIKDISRAKQEKCAVGGFPTCLVMGDWNSEDRPNLVVTSFGRNIVQRVWWTWNKTPEQYGLNSSDMGLYKAFPRALVRAATVGDFNGDDLQDLAFANYGSNNVYVSIAQEADDGKVNFEIQYDSDHDPSTAMMPDWCSTTADKSPMNKGPTSIATGYFDKAAALDVVVASYNSGTISILLNQEEDTNTFAFGQTVQVGKEPCSVAVADFDSKNGQDIAVANFASDTLCILYNDGTGKFASDDKNMVTLDTGSGPVFVAVGYATYTNQQGEQVSTSLNSDALPDLVVANYLSNNITVFLNNGDGTFTATTPSSPIYNLLHKDVFFDADGSSIPLSIEGPSTVTVGFFDDIDTDAKTLDIAIGVEFPTHYLKQSLGIEKELSGDEKDEAKILGEMPDDVYIIYGPFGE